MHDSDHDGFAAQLSTGLRKELTLARDSKLHPFERRGMGDYIEWLRTAIDRVAADESTAHLVHEEWRQTRPRCARRAMAVVQAKSVGEQN